MGEHYAAVEEKLGGAILEVIMESVRKKEMSMAQMEYLAENLGGKVFHCTMCTLFSIFFRATEQAQTYLKI